MSRVRDLAMDSVSRSRDTQLDLLARDVAASQTLHEQLAENANQAALAKAQLNVEDVRLGASAAAPDHAMPRGTATKALLAAILGAMGGMLTALIRDLHRLARQH